MNYIIIGGTGFIGVDAGDNDNFVCNFFLYLSKAAGIILQF